MVTVMLLCTQWRGCGGDGCARSDGCMQWERDGCAGACSGSVLALRGWMDAVVHACMCGSVTDGACTCSLPKAASSPCLPPGPPQVEGPGAGTGWGRSTAIFPPCLPPGPPQVEGPGAGTGWGRPSPSSSPWLRPGCGLGWLFLRIYYRTSGMARALPGALAAVLPAPYQVPQPVSCLPPREMARPETPQDLRSTRGRGRRAPGCVLWWGLGVAMAGSSGGSWVAL